MSGSCDGSLLELFRDEARSHLQALNEGLVALEHGPTDARRIEPLMRAAHSIKGAARVVDVAPAVRVAHVLEECLVQAQHGRLTLAPETIDVFLQAADLLGAIAEAAGPDFAAWQTANAARVEAMTERLQQIVVAKEPTATLSPAKPIAQPAVTPEPVEAAPPKTPRPPETELPTFAPATLGADAQPPSETKERAVRVTAASLTRLMGLAGESLVEARWLQPFADSLLKLKKQQALLADTLDELWQALPSIATADRSRLLTADARKRLGECHQVLVERIGEFEDHARQSDDLNSRLYREVIASRMRPFSDGVQGFARLVRDLARQLGKKVQLEVLGPTTDVDRDILEKLEAPLNHLIRNALDHGLETPANRQAAGKPETGRLTLEARHNAGTLFIAVRDDGRGIDLDRLRRKIVDRQLAAADMVARMGEAELLEFLFLPGFSTAEQVTDVSGRGVGLNVVHSMVHAVGGTVRVQMNPGRGTTFQLQLPITLSVIRAVLVEIAGEPYAFPHNRIDRLLRLQRSELGSLENRQYFTVDGRNVGIVPGRQVLDLEAAEPGADDLFVILFSDHKHQYGLVVDGFRGEQDLVVRPLDVRLGKVPNVGAAAILDDGSPVLIVDLDDLRRSIEKLLQGGKPLRTSFAGPQQKKRVLVVDDSITVREVQRQLLAGHGYDVETAVDGMEGWNVVRQGAFDLVITDIDMPRLNGLELVRMIRAEPALQRIPLVIVSYKDREQDRSLGLEAGANYYLTKSSFHDDTLVQVVAELIGEAGS